MNAVSKIKLTVEEDERRTYLQNRRKNHLLKERLRPEFKKEANKRSKPTGKISFKEGEIKYID